MESVILNMSFHTLIINFIMINTIANQQTKRNMSKNNLVETLITQPILVWNKKIPNTQLERFQTLIADKYNLPITCFSESYWDLHKWSTENFPDFWKELWHYFDIIASKPYTEVFTKIGKGFLDNTWFKGAELNFAENLLRYRDNTPALICLVSVAYRMCHRYVIDNQIQIY
ncbi:UNVERIFIED_CONTAM: Acetoacetyl-CoA synthetase [Trichonephila clavipes]